MIRVLHQSPATPGKSCSGSRVLPLKPVFGPAGAGGDGGGERGAESGLSVGGCGGDAEASLPEASPKAEGEEKFVLKDLGKLILLNVCVYHSISCLVCVPLVLLLIPKILIF